MASHKAPSNLQAHLGYWTRMVSNSVSHGFARKVESEGVTVAEWAFLRVLYDFERLAPSQLAERMGMTKSAISKLADRLVAKKLVEQRPDPKDGRGQILALTLAGRTLVPRLAALADENDTEFFGALGVAERRQLERLLKKIVAAHRLTNVPTN